MNEMKYNKYNGIALVAILAILVVLAILASTFSVLVSINQKTSKAQINSQKADMLIKSGIAHAKSLLQVSMVLPIDNDNRRYDLLFETFGKNVSNNWINVYDNSGALEGRYKITVEDESAKVNINTVANMGKFKGCGWSTSEISLPNALGIHSQNAKKILDYKYGKNKLPGTRGDDDNNNAFLMSDGIDNNANGVIDEFNEGINDPGEYNFISPVGDDRVFSSVSEVFFELFNSTKKILNNNRNKIYRGFLQRATLYSIDYPGSPTLPNDAPADINAVTVRQCKRRLIKANKTIPLGERSKGLSQMAVNIVDYRDQNHVLSTIGNSYGVEAVCFNELLANDGSECRSISDYLSKAYNNELNSKDLVFTDCSVINGGVIYPDLRHKGSAYNNGQKSAWDIEFKSSKKIELIGPAKNQISGEKKDLWDNSRIRAFKKFADMRDNIGKYPSKRKGNYISLSWPENYFKNCYLNIAFCNSNSLNAISRNDVINKIKILSSTRDGVLTLERVIVPKENSVARCVLYSWDRSKENYAPYVRAFIPNVNNSYMCQDLQPKTYYLPIMSNWARTQKPDELPRMGFGPYDSLSSDDREHRSHKWEYGGSGKNSIPIRTSSKGYIQLFVRSGKDVKPANNQQQYDDWSRTCNNWTVSFMRPEVIELINISSKPISIRNWTLTFNTGSIVNDIGTIDFGFGCKLNGIRPDSNPVIDGNGYFYLVNNLQLFRNSFAGGKPKYSWGGNSNEENPVWVIPSDSWGVQYKIKNAKATGKDTVRIILENERFRQNQFKGELIEATRRDGNGEIVTATGSRYAISANGPDWIELKITGARGDWGAYQHFLPSGGKFQPAANQIMILGMPAKGGVVSMTLKNQYNQIASRTIDYGYRNKDPDEWYGESTEKIDPVRFNWIVRSKPSISGRKEQAINKSMKGNIKNPPFVKNGPFASVVEVKNIRRDKDFQNIGSSENSRAKRNITAMVNVFANSSIRLEAGDESAEKKGWKVAIGKVESSNGKSLTSSIGNWENGQWKNQIVRFMTGKLAGESFPIFDNSKHQLTLVNVNVSSMPKSVPGRKSFRPAKGDVFSIGPGYNSPLCYTRKSNEEGEWLWKKRIPVKGNYDIYLFGLNDAINTTEFLEENNNSPIDVEIWNFSSNCYNTLCKRKRYLKEDCFYAGKISPQNISDDGDFKLKLVAHNVVELGLKQSAIKNDKAQKNIKTGIAWFNYAVIAPVPVHGKINVNNASERLLRSLSGINKQLAHNIFAGIDANNKMKLKPYNKLGDLLYVKGMTIDILERNANILCLNTYSYTLDISAQVIKDINNDGKFLENKGDKVEAVKHLRCIISANPQSKNSIKILEQITLTSAQ